MSSKTDRVFPVCFALILCIKRWKYPSLYQKLLAVLLLLIILLIVLILLVIHNNFLRMSFVRSYRFYRLPQKSGFILCPEKQCCQQSAEDRCGDTSCGGFEAAGEDPEKSAFANRFLHTFGKTVTETG